MEDYDQIFYLDCPRFTIGKVDQWGEHGYLLFEDKVYAYEVDRKDQCDRTYAPTTIAAFLADAEQRRIRIPDEFMAVLIAVQNELSLVRFEKEKEKQKDHAH